MPIDDALEELEKDFAAVYAHAREAVALRRYGNANLGRARRILKGVAEDLRKIQLSFSKKYTRDTDTAYGWIGSGTGSVKLSELKEYLDGQRTAAARKTTPADFKVELAKAGRQIDKLERKAVSAAGIADEIVADKNAAAHAAEHITDSLLSERSRFVENLDAVDDHDLDDKQQRRLDALRDKVDRLLSRLDDWDAEDLEAAEAVAERLAAFGRSLKFGAADPKRHTLNTRDRRKTTKEVMNTRVPKKR